MTASLVFQIVNSIVLPAWLILIFFPGKSWRNQVIYGFSMLMALVYIVYVIKGLGNMDMQSFNSLEGVTSMFTSEEAVLTGWVHYLVFDLLIGNWILTRSRKNEIPHLLVVPCLLLCFMFGPAGYLLYQFIHLIRLKKIG